MTTPRWLKLKISVVSFIFTLLFGVEIFAQEPIGARSTLESAAILFQQQAPASAIIEALEGIQYSTDDPMLFAQATFLASEVYLRENQLDKALAELQKFHTPGRTFPQTILCENWLRTGMIYLKQKN